MSPYTKSSKNLPSYVSKQSEDIKNGWIEIFNASYTKYGEEKALIIANTWLKKRLQTKKKEIVAKSEKLRRIELTPNEEGEFIKKSADGEEYVSFCLTDIFADSNGDTYSEDLLKRWADEINAGKAIVGDIDHDEYDEILATTGSSEMIAKRLQEKKGIAKAIKAVYEKGRLWLRAIIDKRYRNLIKSKGVSLEAYVERDTSGKIVDGDLYGFSFMVTEPQANPRAVVSD